MQSTAFWIAIDEWTNYSIELTLYVVVKTREVAFEDF